MTAIVGILNRNGVAFAADSAATHTLSVDNKRKITNHANKIFELSRFKPVGIAICGNLSFMGMPWEDAIKLYRTGLEKGSSATLVDYIQEFMNYVRTTILPMFVDEQKQHLRLLSNGLKNEVVGIAVNELKNSGEEVPISLEDEMPIICAKLTEFIGIYEKKEMKNGKDFDGYEYDGFVNYARTVIEETLHELCDNDQCPKGFFDLFSKALYNIVVSKVHVYLGTTELIFWGYGESDVFPTCHSIKISAALDGRIKWTDSSHFTISNQSSAWIVPYAQTDVSNTVVRGVEDNLRKRFGEEASIVLEKFKDELVNKLRTTGAPKEFLDAISGLDTNPYVTLFSKDMDQYIQSNYIDKLMGTVSYLMKEDLAEMAESLVKMTCLKRHFTTDEETVGGPVDVAVATRGDGFVWIKRKHYFSPEINHHFFER